MASEKNSKVSILTNGIIKENPVLRLVLGTCSCLAVTTAVSSALGMGAAFTFVLVCANILISLLRNVIPAKVHLPCYIVIIAGFVTIVQMFMRRRLVVKSFNQMGLTCFEPRGAFYAFPCIKSTGMSSQEFCTKLLEQKHVAIIPGDAFGASGEGYARVSYAYSVEHLKEALKRIKEFLQENGIYHGEA